MTNLNTKKETEVCKQPSDELYIAKETDTEGVST